MSPRRHRRPSAAAARQLELAAVRRRQHQRRPELRPRRRQLRPPARHRPWLGLRPFSCAVVSGSDPAAATAPRLRGCENTKMEIT